MKRALLAPMMVFAGLAACQEITTSPAARSPELRSYRLDNDEYPPPPASDTGAAATSPDMGFFTLNVTYLLNKPENSGYLAFQKEQPEGVTIAPNARIRLSQGVFSGRGEIRVQNAEGLLILDLAEVVEGPGGSSFNACAAPTGEVTPSALDTGDGGQPSCFRVVLENGRFTPALSTDSQRAGDVTFGPCPASGGVCLKSGR